ncbi:MAG: hypothetical protein LUC24_04205, partial [Bacteroidales bacterium]|nr:hypothetical protein [Bacteroidales bacterium]
LEMTEGEHASNLFVATHSPYIVTAFLERLNLDLSLFLTRLPKETGIIVRTASEKEVSDVYNYDMDVFFNNEYFG